MPRFFLIPLIVACALFMENMDSTIITTSLPVIAQDLRQNPLALNLALTAYFVSLAVFIPVSGWVADRYGSRTVFAAAIVVFVAGSLACAAASGLAAFVAARFFQGLGGAMMVPVGRLVLLRTVPKSGLIAAFNVLTIPALMGPIIGPPLGGFITLHFNWRWIFLINLPIGLLGFFLVLRYIPNIREAHTRSLDVRGFLLSGIGLSATVLGLSMLGRHLVPGGVTAACITGGALALAAYIWHARRTPHPLIDLNLLKLATFNTGVVGGSLFRIGVGATPFLLPLMLQLGFGLNPFQSGLLTCAGAMGAMFMKTLTVRILRRYGFRTVLTVNVVLASCITAGYGLFDASTPHFLIVAVLLFSGCLRSLQFTGLNAISFADVSRPAMSDATSLASMAQRLSQSIGVVIAAYVLEAASSLHGHAAIEASDFWPAFLAVGALSAGSLFFHLKLPADAGAEVSGHRSSAGGRR